MSAVNHPAKAEARGLTHIPPKCGMIAPHRNAVSDIGSRSMLVRRAIRVDWKTGSYGNTGAGLTPQGWQRSWSLQERPSWFAQDSDIC